MNAKSLKHWIPNVEEEDEDIMIAMLNGYQGQDMDAIPHFSSMEHLKEMIEECGAGEWLAKYLTKTL